VDFGPRGPNWHTVFGDVVEHEPSVPPPRDTVVGMAWLALLHTRVRIERGLFWQAEYWLSMLRDKTLELACARLELPTANARGFDALPAEVAAPLEDALARSLEPDELRRALRVATGAFLAELGRSDGSLRARLEPVVVELAAADRCA
jgi:hypothetical protein